MEYPSGTFLLRCLEISMPHKVHSRKGLRLGEQNVAAEASFSTSMSAAGHMRSHIAEAADCLVLTASQTGRNRLAPQIRRYACLNAVLVPHCPLHPCHRADWGRDGSRKGEYAACRKSLAGNGSAERVACLRKRNRGVLPGRRRGRQIPHSGGRRQTHGGQVEVWRCMSR
jgi:hypothetical protein